MDNELEHYGVLGMKWGIRKDPSRAYSKAGAKLSKLDRKASSASIRGAASEQRALSKQRRATGAILFPKHKARVASRATRRALRRYQRAQQLQVKAYRWNRKMEKAFKDVKLSNMDEEYVSLGKKYSNMTLESIMQNNVSMNSLMSMDDYYRRAARG